MATDIKPPEEVQSGKRVLFTILAFMLGTIALLLVIKILFKL